MGIRTPWTLQSDNVWKETHRLGGRMWMAGGILIILIAFIIPINTLKAILMAGILAIIVIVPVVYSYLYWKREQKRQA